MVRFVRIVAVVLVASLTVLAIALIGMRVAAPDLIDGRESDAAVMALAVDSLGKSRGSIQYVSLDGRDPSPKQLAELHERTKISVLPYSARPKDKCRTLSAPPYCEDDDFIKIRFLSMPLWRTVLVQETTLACEYEHVLVRAPTRWIDVSVRGFCV